MYEFKLEPEEIKKFLKWSKSLPITKDVAGTQFVFQFIPTGHSYRYWINQKNQMPSDKQRTRSY